MNFTPEQLRGARHVRTNPMVFVDKFLGAKPWAMQRAILEALFRPNTRRVGVKSCHGSGKTYLAAIAALTWLYGGPDRIVITTAPTARQVKNLLWREIRQLHQSCHNRGIILGGTMPPQAAELRISENWLAIGFASNDPVNMQGWHCAGGILIILDEANGVQEDIWDALAGVMVGQNDRLLAIANPTEPSGPFYNMWVNDPDCVKFTISAFDTPNVQAGKEIIKGMVTTQWVEDRRKMWGEGSALWKSRVLGLFPDSAPDALVSQTWVELANARWHEHNENNTWGKDSRAGIDIARLGPDTTFLAKAYEQGIRSLHPFPKGTNTETAGMLAMFLRGELGDDVADVRIDADGVGAGVFDIMHDDFGSQVIEIRGGMKSLDPAQFFNRRTEWLWNLRRLLDPTGPNPIAIPPSPGLTNQLVQTKWRVNRKGQIQVESKDELKSRIDGSPDEMDACAYALADVGEALIVSIDPSMGYLSNHWKQA